MGCTGSNLKTEANAEAAAEAAAEAEAGPGPESQTPQAEVAADQDMGCGGSKTVVVVGPASDITDEIKANVRESWALFLQANEDSGTNNGLLIFIKLFEIAPDAYTLFEFVEGLSEEDLFANEKLGWHVKKVTDAISAMVDGLDDLNAVAKMLEDLGRRHADYGVKEEYFVPIKEAVVFGVEKTLGDKFTEEHKQAWTITMEAVAHFMLQGLKDKPQEEPSTHL